MKNKHNVYKKILKTSIFISTINDEKSIDKNKYMHYALLFLPRACHCHSYIHIKRKYRMFLVPLSLLSLHTYD